MTHQMGDIVQCKVLGSFCLIDQGEIDWKIVGINDKDPLYPKIHTLNDIERFFPGLLPGMFDFFKYYKTFDGKKENSIYEDKWFDEDYSLSII